MTAIAPTAHAQMDFDANATITTVTGNARVGFNTVNAITVVANSGTNASGGILTYNNSTLNMSGGTVGGSLAADGHSKINLSGGTIGGSVVANGDSVVTFTGGSVALNLSAQNGVINFYGGSVGGNFTALGGGKFNIFGSGLSAGSPDVGFLFTTYTLSGSLGDGTDITGKSLRVSRNGGASFTLNNTVVPEPGAVAFGFLAAGSVLGLILRKRC